MARVTRFQPSPVAHPFTVDRRARPQDGSGGHVGLVMAIGVVALLLGGLVMHASADTAHSHTAEIVATDVAQ